MSETVAEGQGDGTSPVWGEPITVIDLFAGCGGLTRGLLDFHPVDDGVSPFRPVAAVEIEPSAAYTYATNFARVSGDSEHVFLGDIKDWVDGKRFPDHADVILGGPPCQGFSGLGKGNPDDPRNKLWEQYFKVVQRVQPSLFVIENVDRFRSSREMDALKADFKKLGYQLEARVLNAADYGAAQTRQRTIVLGRKDTVASFRFPEPTHVKAGAPTLEGTDTREPWRTLENVIGEDRVPLNPRSVDLPALLADGMRSEIVVSRRVKDTGGLTDVLLKTLAENIPGPFRTEQLHIGRTPTGLSLARYRSIRPGENRKALEGKYAKVDGKKAYLSTESWDGHKNGSGDVMGRLVWNKPSVTIRTEFYKPEKGRYLHPEADRPLTHLEAALIQGFPKDFLWCGSKIQIARQIGNAVPPPLATAIAREIYRALRPEAADARATEAR
ncbi:DNA cytosine methyltransferase [Yinghuangia seranimata]|uniref:DNA cytosine methyltransferase n=1 Tax=Yinghuangia seranimata TaxID=408067 RepID=UPI00248BE9C4|nr:DNA cytosine methyltransferase [Yinghuangia seranimata]MDI2130875.1 DNA cytosine methyltransferase [Yinghuangia seranimata]